MFEFTSRTKWYRYDKRGFKADWIKPPQFEPKYDVGDVGYFNHENKRYFCVILAIIKIETKSHSFSCVNYLAYRYTYHLKIIS